MLPPGAPAEPAGDHHGRGASLAQHDVVVEEGVDSGPLLVRPEQHDLPVQGHQPGADQYGNDDGEIERQRPAEESDAVTTHPRWLYLRRFRLPVQPGKDVGTHPIDVTASECAFRSIRPLCDDDVMWTMSQPGIFSRPFGESRRPSDLFFPQPFRKGVWVSANNKDRCRMHFCGRRARVNGRCWTGHGAGPVCVHGGDGRRPTRAGCGVRRGVRHTPWSAEV